MIDLTKTTFEQDAQLFTDLTGVKFKADGLMSAILGRKSLDIPEIDKMLQRRYPTEFVGVSINDFLLSKFGKDCLYVYDKWTLIPDIDE